MAIAFEDPTTESKVFKFTGGTWQFSGGNPAWATGSAPVTGTSAAAATGDQYHVRISIDLKLTHLHARVKVRPNIYSAIQPAIVLAGAYLQVPIYQKSLLPSQRFTGGGKADLAPKSHFFTDHGNIVQTAAEAYGPVSVDKTNRFRTTALFKRQGGTEPKAYAVVNGFVVIQRDPGNNTVVNLVLKPFQQPMAGFTPVKYFIYRGITLTDFLKGINNTDEKLIRDAAGSSAFISRLWPMHTAQNGAEPFESKALGYDPDNQDPNGADLLDDLFFRQDSNIQFPIATKGEHIGNFFTSGGTGTFGFEIVLEEGEFQPDLAYVRKVSHEISVAGMPAGTDAEKFAVRLKREEILNFMDPAAFYGLHRSDKGIITVDDGAGAKTNLPSEQMYENVIDKFNTKNTLYIDIRNENGQSYNFYGKYDDGNGNAFGIGHSIAVITDQAYASDSWPLIIIPATIPNIFYQIFIRLRKDYNKKPILYIEHGRPTTLTTKGRFIAGNHLGTDPNLTNSIGFRMPNHDPGDGNRIGTAWLLKLHYGLQIDAGNTPFPIEVPPTENYKDNLFGPLSLKLNWTGAFKFSWYSAQDKKFIDAGNLGFSHIVNRGLAIEDETQDDRVLFYAAGKDIFNNTNTAFVPYKGMTGGVSKRNSFFEEALLFEGYRLEYDLFEDNGAEIKSLALAPAAINPRPTEGMLMLGLTKDEYTTLKGLPGLNAVYPRNVQLEELAGSPFTVNGKTYRKYKAGVRGLNNDGNHHTAFPVEDIHVYSVDRFFFFSKDFSDAQALPTSYTRNYEESFGAVKRISPKYRIKYIWVAAKTIGIQGKDLRYEIVPGDKVVIKNAADIDNNGTYSVTAVNWTGSDSEIVVDEGISSNTGKLGDLHEVEKPYEDFFIAKDIRPDLNGIQPMPTIVQQFISAVDAAADNAAGLTALTNAVNTFGLEIWNRAREICFNNTFEYADDRILYWARIKMLAALKGHAQVLKSIKERERLTGLLEEKSRGLDSIDIPQAGIKVLVSGSDPFYLGKSILNHNPAGAAALAMDGRSFTRTVNGNPVTFHIESVMLPFRYRDFDRNGGQGIVEEVFEKYINPAANGFKAVDMILALGRNNKRSFFVDRFAARFRGGIIDNENRPSPPGNPSFKLSPALAGDEFYETTLPVNKLVPPSNPGPNGFDVIYNNAFRYNWTDAADTVQTASFLRSANATGQSKVEDAGHPNNALLNGMVPASLTDATTPKKTDIQSASGSAGNYLGNEMFYRVSRLRAAHNIGLPAGSLHVPKIQSDGGYFVPGDNKSLIDALIEEIAKAAAP
ncbi:MAG: hypothetical protein GY950_15680 [bacterium]|nr:hypothetical protein [bacterium]